MKIGRGDVFWAEFEGSRRPVAVLTRNEAIPLLSRVVVAPATRTIRSAPSEIRLGPQDGMPDDCVLSLDNMRLVRKSLLRSRITSLPASRMEEICERLGYTLGC